MIRWLPFAIASLIGINLAGCRPSPIDLSIADPRDTYQTPPRHHPALSSQFDLRVIEPVRSPEEKPAQRMHGSVFVDVAIESGIDHQYVTGEQKLLLMVQPTGGGCGWIDYDSDGNWDLYLNQGGDPSAAPSSTQPTDQLFRNLDGQRFEQVTFAAGIDDRDYSQGVAIGDYDNDGFADIFVTNVGKCTFLKNQGDGTFTDVTDRALQQVE